jgi:hypothetical protein
MIKDNKIIALKNKSFRDYTIIIKWENNSVNVTYLRCNEPIDVELIDTCIFTAMLQNEDWELCDYENI